METQVELTKEGILTTTLSHGVVLSRTLKNGFGQISHQGQPNTHGGFIITRNSYNGKGQLVHSQMEGMAPALTAYNELGNVVRQTVLLDELHPDDPTKNRISESSMCYQIREDGIYQIQTSTTYNAEGLPITQTTGNHGFPPRSRAGKQGPFYRRLRTTEYPMVRIHCSCPANSIQPHPNL